MMGAAFSQCRSTPDTPTTSVFSTHFEDSDMAKVFIRSSWKLLPEGKLFVNADCLPSYMGGGDCGIESVIRMNRTVEFILSIVLINPPRSQKVKVLSIGNFAMTCGSALSRRLRAVGFTVEQITCKQPSALSRVDYNKHLIGIDTRYQFSKIRTKCIYHHPNASSECFNKLGWWIKIVPMTTPSSLFNITKDGGPFSFLV